jgi:asparagine synthase (glutamine-hydrolysing)
MCGIFSLLNNYGMSDEEIYKNFIKGSKRGPEKSIILKPDNDTLIGFHRLAINGLNEEADQPLKINEITLICNGEIYNYKELYKMMNIKPTTQTDCEVIIHLYEKYGIDQTLQMIDGVFAFMIFDMRVSTSQKIYISRDPYGVRPMYYFYSKQKIYDMTGFASDLDSLYGIYKIIGTKLELKQFEPGTYTYYSRNLLTKQNWENERWIYQYKRKYNTIGFESIMTYNNMNDIYSNIQKYLTNAVNKRCLTTERPIACLLSGGLDSSLITVLVNKYMKKHNMNPLETYSIGIEGSGDLFYAKKVADFLGTKHTEIIVTEDDMFNAVDEVIYHIGSYDTTTVRASIGNYLIGKYISANSDAKVIFNGDGSDEVAGGYMYMHKAPDSIEFDKECRRLLSNIYKYDVLRSDKCISSHGLEPRTPFLDRAWINYYLSISPDIRNHSKNGQMEKHLIRKSFSKEIYGEQLLPEEVLWRSKEAFSDGVSKNDRSLYEILQEKIQNKQINNFNLDKLNGHLLPETLEQIYYRSIFEKYYEGCGNIIDFFWMPKFVDAKDSSARTLDIYKEKHELKCI